MYGSVMDKMISSTIKHISEMPERKMNLLNIWGPLVDPSSGFIL